LRDTGNTHAQHMWDIMPVERVRSSWRNSNENSSDILGHNPGVINVEDRLRVAKGYALPGQPGKSTRITLSTVNGGVASSPRLARMIER
jgi:hypothetical protein